MRAAGRLHSSASPLGIRGKRPQNLCLLADTSRLPSPRSVLPRADPWTGSSITASPTSVSGVSSVGSTASAAPLIAALRRNDLEEVWTRFCRLPRNVDDRNRIMRAVGLQLFVRLLTTLKAEKDDYGTPWARARAVKSALDDAGAQLGAQEYAALLNLALRSGHLEFVEPLWQEMLHRGVSRNTNVWNHYIAATCDAYPPFWPRLGARPPDGAGEVSRNREASMLARRGDNSARDLLVRMVSVEGIPANARTYELLVLAEARVRNLDVARQVVERVWLSKDRADGILAPQFSTLTAVLEAWAFNFNLTEGLEIVLQVLARHPELRMASRDAEHFWTRALRLILVHTEPRGPLPTRLFDDFWRTMTQQHRFAPTAGTWAIRTEFLEWKNQFDALAESLELIMTLPGQIATTLARRVLTKTVVGLGNTDRIQDGVKLLEKWAPRGLDLRQELEEFVRSRGGSRERLALYEEDDDDESILGF